MKKNNSPLVSVVMPVYNNALFVAEAIESILQQTYQNLELIVVNDGSTDESQAIIEKYAKKDGRIRFFSQENFGQAVATNKALEVARGKYIAKMDGDDVCHPERIEKQVAYMQAHPECDALTSFVVFKNQDLSERLPDWGNDRRCITPKQIKNMLPFHNCVTNAVMMFRPQPIKHLRYTPIEAAEDYDLWLRMVSYGYSIHKLPEELYTYRMQPQSTMHKANKVSHEKRMAHFKKSYLKRQFNQRKFSLIELKVLMSLLGIYLSFISSKLLIFIKFPSFLLELLRVRRIAKHLLLPPTSKLYISFEKIPPSLEGRILKQLHLEINPTDSIILASSTTTPGWDDLPIRSTKLGHFAFTKTKRRLVRKIIKSSGKDVTIIPFTKADRIYIPEGLKIHSSLEEQIAD